MTTRPAKRIRLALLLCPLSLFAAAQSTLLRGSDSAKVFKAGAVAVNITPTNFPVVVNGGFLEKTATSAVDKLHARALALDDGTARLVICVVDTCMMPRDLIDEAKELASRQTGLPTDRMLVSATHTHSAPSSMACLGSRADTNYVKFLPGKIAEAISGAIRHLEPARIGWSSVDDWDHTFCRRWIRRPDKLIVDPFGNATGRAHMHPGHQSPDAIGPSGPVDPQLSVLAVMLKDGTPLGLLANYSQHYYGATALSADYYGKFAEHISTLVAADMSRLTSISERGVRNAKPDQSRLTSAATGAKFVAMMSQGTSGDQQWMDYAAPRKNLGYDAYAKEVAERAMEAYRKIEWHDWVPLKMAEAKLPLNYRVPDPERLAWARATKATYEGRLPKNWPEVYASEAIILHERQKTELKLQALSIGDLAITTLPNEVYSITGLKLKAQSPAKATFNIELANGAEGYIPPPEQHALGGYTTFPARTAGLEVQAEPKITETLLGLLETVTGKKRSPLVEVHGPYSEAVLKAKPVAYWRLNEIQGDTASDATGARRNATYEPGVARYLPGVGSGSGVTPNPALTTSAFSGASQINRAAHFAGGRLRTDVNPGKSWSVEFWLWNGLPVNLRPMTGILLATRSGEQLCITGTLGQPGRLCYSTGANLPPKLVGHTELGLKQWHHVVLAREGDQVAVHLDGALEAEFSGKLSGADEVGGLIFGGNGLPADTFEGRLDEIAFYDRALKPDEVASHWKISGIPARRAKEVEDREREAKLAAERAQPPVLPAAHRSAILGLKPVVCWSLDKSEAGRVADLSPGKVTGTVEGGVTLSQATFAAYESGRIRATSDKLGEKYSVSFWFRNDLANDARAVTAYLFSRGKNGDTQAPGDHVGIGGTYRSELTGRLIFFNGNGENQVVAGRTSIPPGTWNHVVCVRDGKRVTAWLNGEPEAEFSGEAAITTGGVKDFFLGARSDHFAPLEGYLGEFALLDRALTAEEAKQIHKASGQTVGTAKSSHSPASAEKAGVRGKAPPLQSPSLSPAQALKTIHVPAGFKVELAASEPLTLDPTAIDWDASGRLWVVEMADYPLGMDGNGKPGGRVRVLEDTDGDGRYDKSTLFAEGLNFPNGILTWRDGVLVTAAPDILYLRDTDGDGKADVKQVLFTGFFEGNQQLRVNGLRWGLDNWVYCANGGHRAGYGDKAKLTSKLNGKTYEIGSRDFRFRPDSGELEPESGPTQFGRNRDDWGNWFGVQNSWPLWHYVLSDRYLQRNPHVASPSPVQQVVTPGNPKVYPASALEKRFHSFDQSGRFTSACSAMIYRDELLFGSGYRHAFTCEPFHNVVQHNIITDDGVSFTFHRAPEEKQFDFFASEDRWCRPVMTRTGPDGALWVVDMYRYMIEHPQWLPANGKEELLPHYREGDDKGRIYRVLPVGAKGERPKAKALAKLGIAELVAALDSTNEWQRDKAQQVLFWRADKSAVPHLEKLARTSDNPLARLHALCTLDGLDALKPSLVERALADAHPGVRINALRLAETRGTPEVIAAAAKLASDQDPKVRLQLAFSLGEWKDAKAGEALGKLAVTDSKDAFMMAAIMSSAMAHCSVLVEAVEKTGGASLDRMSEPLLQLALGIEDRGSIAKLLKPALAGQGKAFTPQQIAMFGGFLDTLGRRNSSLDKLRSGSSTDALSAELKRTDALFAFARTAVADKGASIQDRAAAAGLLAREPSQREAAISLLSGWLTPQTPGDAQRVAVRSLALTGDAKVPSRVLEHWSSFGPETRAAVLEALLGREPWAHELLQHVKAGEVSPMVFDAARKAQLQRHQSNRVKNLANQVFKSASNSSRAQVVEQFRPAIALKGDAGKGQAVYAKLCASCHKVGNVGNEVGPDLRSVVEHPPEKLLINILDPSSDVQPGFFAYSCTLKSGDEVYGVIANETANSISMKLADGTTRTVLTSEIESLRGSNLSLMPEGLEAGLKPQDLADLISWLKSAK